jgi:hypothetical protein
MGIVIWFIGSICEVRQSRERRFLQLHIFLRLPAHFEEALCFKAERTLEFLKTFGSNRRSFNTLFILFSCFNNLLSRKSEAEQQKAPILAFLNGSRLSLKLFLFQSVLDSEDAVVGRV